MELALPKKAYRIKCDWERMTVLCDTTIKLVVHMRQKDVIEIDGKFINFSYVSTVEEVDIMKNDSIDWAMSRAKKQEWALWAVATERVMSREESNYPNKMKISKIMSWMQWFISNGRDRKDSTSLKKYYDLYISSWGNIDDIWPKAE